VWWRKVFTQVQVCWIIFLGRYGHGNHIASFFSIHRSTDSYAMQITSPPAITKPISYASYIYLQQRHTLAVYSTNHIKAFQMSTNVLDAQVLYHILCTYTYTLLIVFLYSHNVIKIKIIFQNRKTIRKGPRFTAVHIVHIQSDSSSMLIPPPFVL